LTRAVLEGVAFGLKDALGELERLGMSAANIRLIGQGATSPLWAQIVADVFNRPLSIPRQADAAYGAALITAMGVGMLPSSVEALEDIIDGGKRVEPDRAAAQDYADLFAIYRDADTALRPISERLHEFETRTGKRETK